VAADAVFYMGLLRRGAQCHYCCNELKRET
jgi:hypothetical protein